jgi:hypothetical protein
MHLKSRPKVPPFASGKLVNGDTFSLLLKLSCFIIFGDIKGGHNRK